MDTKITNARINDIAQIRQDIELIKNILLSEGELTDYAKETLTDARNTPCEEYIDHEKVKKMIHMK